MHILLHTRTHIQNILFPMLRILSSTWISLFIIGLSVQLSGQIVISEYSASNMNQFADSYEKHEDWIELHNRGTEDVDLRGYALSDKEDKPQKWVIPESVILPAGGYKVVLCSGRDEVRGRELHASFKLTQTKDNEYVVLTDPAGTVLESQKLELTLLGHSRVKNDSGIWMVDHSPTPGAEATIGSFSGYTAAPLCLCQQAAMPPRFQWR